MFVYRCTICLLLSVIKDSRWLRTIWRNVYPSSQNIWRWPEKKTKGEGACAYIYIYSTFLGLHHDFVGLKRYIQNKQKYWSWIEHLYSGVVYQTANILIILDTQTQILYKKKIILSLWETMYCVKGIFVIIFNSDKNYLHWRCAIFI